MLHLPAYRVQIASATSPFKHSRHCIWLIIAFFFSLYLQNEISEVFDKLQVEDESNVTVIEPTVIDSNCNGSNICESPQLIASSKKAERPSLRKLNNGTTIVDDWSSSPLAQFETLIKMEMENLACVATETPMKINATSVSTTAVKSNILKPEKHVS